MVIDVYRTYSCWRTREKNISGLQSEELADITDNLINTVHHIARTSFLYCLPVYVEMKTDGLNISELLDIHPFTDGDSANLVP